LICFGLIGLLKIFTGCGAKGFWAQIFSRIQALFFFVPLYLALLMLLISYSLVEFNTDTIISGNNSGLGASMIIITVNYLVEYYRSELRTGRWTIRMPIEIVFERFMYALPLAALVMFGVLPLANKFSGNRTEKLIAIGIILSKFVMDLVVYHISRLGISWDVGTETEEDK